MSIINKLKDKIVGTPRDKEAEKFLKTRFEKESVKYKKLNSGISLPSSGIDFLIVSESIVAYLDKSVRADDLYVSNDKDRKQIKIVSLLEEPFIYRKDFDGSTIELKCKQASYKVI